MKKIILVEDDEKLSMLIKQYLGNNDFEVSIINNGSLAVDAILTNNPDIVVLDLMLPGKDGLSICREIRPSYHGYILFLTASEDDLDHVAGIELGADDFIVKPIQPRVLLARIRMLLRRVIEVSSHLSTSKIISESIESNRFLEFGSLSINYIRRSVVLNGKDILVTTREFDLLWLLASHAEEVLSRDFIYKTLRGIEYDGLDRTIDTNIVSLRKKLGDSASLSKRILTVRGQGYLFIPDDWNENLSENDKISEILNDS